MIPNPQAAVVDGSGKITPVWFRWLSELRGNADAGASQADMDAAIAAIATALGSPDGTVANIPPQSEADIRLLQGAGIAITGDAENGYAIAIRALSNSGTGALLGIARDAYGRVSGTTDATITGTAGQITVANGDAVAGPPTLSLADVTDAGGGTLQKTAFDAKGRKTGTSAATASDVPIVDAGGYFTGTDVEAALQELGAGGGGGGGGGAWTVVKKTSDEARTSTTTLADDSQLTMSLAASTRYRIRVQVLYSQANAAMDIKYGVNYTGTTTSAYLVRKEVRPASAAGTANIVSMTYASLISGAGVLASVSGVGEIDLDIILLTGTAGTFSFQWAQNTSDAGALTVLALSYLEYMSG